jgi:hypothetical protein
MELWQVSASVIGTITLLWLTWRVSVRQGRFHGVFRFVSFEALLLLVILNGPVWFDHPLSGRQNLSWIFLALSALLAIHCTAPYSVAESAQC